MFQDTFETSLKNYNVPSDSIKMYSSLLLNMKLSHESRDSHNSLVTTASRRDIHVRVKMNFLL